MGGTGGDGQTGREVWLLAFQLITVAIFTGLLVAGVFFLLDTMSSGMVNNVTGVSTW